MHPLDDRVASGARGDDNDRLRRLVAEQLGVEADAITPDVSLTDDLAADSLDVVELFLAVEGELGIVVPRRRIDQVRTFADLVALVRAGSAPHRARTHPEVVPVLARTRIVAGGDGRRGEVQRSGLLTPYAAEVIADEALHAGAGTLLDVRIGTGADDASIAAARELFAWLAQRGVCVVVRPDV